MSQLIKVTKNYQVTLPAKLRDVIQIAEGDYLEASTDGTSFVFHPKKIDDRNPDQDWFWTKAWQKKEAETDEDLARGRVKRHKSMSSMIRELESLS